MQKIFKEILQNKKRRVATYLTVFMALIMANQAWVQFAGVPVSYYETTKENRMTVKNCLTREALPYLQSEEEQEKKKEEKEKPELYARAAALIDGDSLRVLYEKDGKKEYPMASTTKIMTCIYTIENSNLDDVVTISKRAASQPKVHLGVKEGEKYLLKDLLYALMLESCNDCAVAIAEHVGTSVENFCREMTVKAKNIGCSHTNFVTPNGLDAPEHYTTAEELAKIGAYAVQNEQFLQIIQTKQYQVAEINGKSSHMVANKNAFLQQYNGAIGIKTGYTSKASYCFVGAVRQGEQTFISTVLASGWYPKKTYKWLDTRKLMDYGVQQYKSVPLIHPCAQLPACAVENGTRQTVKVYENVTMKTMLKESEQISLKIEWLQKKLPAPVRKNQLAGYLVVLIDGEEYQKIPLLTAQSCRKWNYSWCIRQTVKQFLKFAQHSNTAF